jgi:hypothetical protein
MGEKTDKEYKPGRNMPNAEMVSRESFAGDNQAQSDS